MKNKQINGLVPLGKRKVVLIDKARATDAIGRIRAHFLHSLDSLLKQKAEAK